MHWVGGLLLHASVASSLHGVAASGADTGVATIRAHAGEHGTVSALDLTVINSLGPVYANDTVTSIVPNLRPEFIPKGTPVTVKLCETPYADRMKRPNTRCRQLPSQAVAAGIVHWRLDAPLDQYSYSLCVGALCGPATKLNAPEIWWSQCVGFAYGVDMRGGENGMRCVPGAVLRIFGKGLAFDGTQVKNQSSIPAKRCLPYKPFVPYSGRWFPKSAMAIRLTYYRRHVAGVNLELSAGTQSCYDATFVLPAKLPAGSYMLEVLSNLPGSMWENATDPDQRMIEISDGSYEKLRDPCITGDDPRAQFYPATDRASLLRALTSAGNRTGGAIVEVQGIITLRPTDLLVLPDCVVLTGKRYIGTASGESSGNKTTTAPPPPPIPIPTLRWMVAPGTLGVDCGMKEVALISTDESGMGVVTIEQLAIEAVALKGCYAIIGSKGGHGLSLRNLNITAFAPMHTAAVFASVVRLYQAKHFLIEHSSFLHCGNNTPGDAHAGVNSPIVYIAESSDGVIRNNLWQVGLSGWHIDTSWNIVQESNIYTGYLNNDVSKPLPNFDGSFWFSSYSQGGFPGAGRFFYANTTHNERPHTKPQVGGGESFTLDGGNSGGYYGTLASTVGPYYDPTVLTTSADVCWRYAGGYSFDNCTTVPDYGGKTGHALQIMSGPGKGQYRRVVAISGPRNRTVTINRAFDPPPSTSSTIQIGPMRGQISLVGNNFVRGGTVQLYAACYDCIVAENTFREFGFSNWGRAPHGVGWQPNLNNVMQDNVFEPSGTHQTGMGVRGCSPTCSGQFGPANSEKTCYPANDHAGHWFGCAVNATSMLGRDCTPFAAPPSIGSYQGAINLQLAWRRNNMSELVLLGPKSAATFAHEGSIPLVDGGLVEGNFNYTGGAIKLATLNMSTNVYVAP